MLFTDSVFLLRFLPVVLAFFFIALAVTPRRWREGPRRFTLPNAVLLAGSVVFLASGAWYFIQLIGVAIVFNYLAALAIGWCRRNRAAPRTNLLPEALLTFAVTGNVVLLAVCRYAIALPADLTNQSFAVPQLLAPFGLIFIVCHAISYVVDVARGTTPPQVSPIRASLYLLFFPLLCAGPLVRYREMGPQLVQRRVTLAAFAYGVRRWLIGFCKVSLIAQTLAGPADVVFAMSPDDLGTLQAWLGAICFSLQIYFDLSGYTDMAIGFGRMFGFRLFENFRWPYGAYTLTEFWRRWNISLFDWCRGYLGLSITENSESLMWRAGRIVVLFLCVGMWHGPGLNLLVWGGMHGLVVALEQVGLGSHLVRLPRVFRHLYLLVAVLVLWVVFRSESLVAALVMIEAMAGLRGPAEPLPLLLTPLHWTALVAAVLTAAPLRPGFSRWLVTVDALTTSTLILVSTSCVFVWSRLTNTLFALTGRQR